MSKKLLSLLLIAALCLSLAPAGLAEEIRIVDPVGANTQINDTEADAPAPCHPERSEAEPKDLSEDSSSLALLRMTDETNEIVASGACGDNLTWTLDSEGKLTIEGSGEMRDMAESAPWEEYKEQIRIVSLDFFVTSIGYYAFQDCVNLTEVWFSGYMEDIRDGAFSGCSSLDYFDIPNRVTVINNHVFENCTALKQINLHNGVTAIGDYAFSGCTSLMEFEMPTQLTGIGSFAFSGCTGLTGVIFSDAVTDIGMGAFANCGGLTRAVFGNGLANIANGAFAQCAGLQELIFTGDAPTIAEYGFAGVTASAYVPADNETWTEGVKQNYGGTLTWTAYVEHVVLAAGQCGPNLNWILDSDGTMTISGTGNMWHAIASRTHWSGCADKIRALVVEDGVTLIGVEAFKNCTFLKSAVISGSVTELSNQAFLNCTGLIDLSLGEGISDIGYEGFAYCSSLQSVRLPSSISSLSTGAFSSCDLLTDIFFAGPAPQFWDGCFYNVTATAYYPEGDETWTEDVMQDYGGTITWMPYTPGEGYAVAVDEEKLPEGVTVTLPEGDSFSGEVTFTVSSPEDQAVLVAVKNGEEYTVLPCTDKDGCHCFTLNVTKDTELVLVYKGDANLDGQVKLKDNLMVKKHIAKSEQIADPLALLAVDTDGSGEIKLRDNLMIKKHIAKSQMIGW